MATRDTLILVRIITITALGIAAPAGAQQRTRPPSEFVAWPPLSDADRALNAPVVEKDAGAEILEWRVHVVDELLGNNTDLQRVLYHYVRLKVFNEKGKEETATIDLTYRAPGAILDVAGRTIKPDGTVLDLDRKTVFQRDLVRAGRAREKAVSFAMPGVEPGSILEYRWRQTEDDNRFRYVRLHFQRDFPVERVTYFVKPLPAEISGGEQMFMTHFNCNPSAIQPDNDGYSFTTLTNVPAARHEPYAPSDPNLEPWALLYYRAGGSTDPDKYWNSEGKKTYKEFKEQVKVNDEIKSAASEAAGAAAKDEDKLIALESWLHKKVRNLFDDDVTEAERQKYFEKLPNDRRRNSGEIVKSGIATSYEMNVVFAALAMQAGLDARPALIADRNEIIFNPKLADRYFLNNVALAVKSGDSWKVVDAGEKLLPPGMVPWQEEGMMALIADSKTPSFITVPASAPEASTDRRTGRLQLSAAGSLEGDVEESYTGFRGEDLRDQINTKSPPQREDWFRDRIVRLFPDAEVTGLVIQNVDDPGKALVVRYHLAAPRFAQVTGKRVLFQPIVFRRAQGSPFSASERHFGIQFPYAWKESDEVHIRLPEGFELDNADSPGSLNLGDPGAYQLRMQVTKGTNPELQVFRDFVFGNRGILFFPPTAYPALKGAFDTIQVRDAHTISLKGN